MARILALVASVLIGAVSSAAATQPPHASAATVVPEWMVGTFFGTNDVIGAGAYVELIIRRDGSAIGVIEGRFRVDGRVVGDRLVFGDMQFVVTRTDEGIRTTQVGDEANVVDYLRS